MTRVAAIMQPTYLPYLGYFELVAASDVFVILDDVQFARRSWQSRNRILAAGQEVMLTIPVRGHDRDSPISAIRTADDQPWRAKHLQSIRHAYGSRPGFAQGFDFLEEHYAGPSTGLAEFTARLIVAASDRLGLSTRFVHASTLACGGARSDHLLALCRAVDASCYISPRGSERYMTEDATFGDSGIPVRYKDFTPLPYDQGRGEFIPYMGFIDAVMNLGWSRTADLIAQGVAKDAV